LNWHTKRRNDEINEPLDFTAAVACTG